MQCAILRVKLRHLNDWNDRRRAIAVQYSAGFEGAGLTTLGSVSPDKQSPIALLATNPEAFHIFHQYVVRAYRRDELRAFLSEAGIGTEIYYPLPLHLQEAFAHLGYSKGDFPEAERAASEVLALPMFPELREEEQQRVVGKDCGVLQLVPILSLGQRTTKRTAAIAGGTRAGPSLRS